MPVGQEDTPTMRRLPSSPAPAAGAPAGPPTPAGPSGPPAPTEPAPAGAGVALVAPVLSAPAPGPAPGPAPESALAARSAAPSAPSACAAPSSSSSGWTCSVIMRATSWGVAAERSAPVNSGFIRPRASLARSLRWKSSAPAGAAIMKTRFAFSPSTAPKSTPPVRRANPREGARTWGLRQCGMAMPPGMPVGAVASRARASAARPSGVSARPAEATTSARYSMTSFLSGPTGTSSLTRSGTMSAPEGGVDESEVGMLFPCCLYGAWWGRMRPAARLRRAG